MSEPTRTSAPRTEEAMNTEEKARRMLEAAKDATPGERRVLPKGAFGIENPSKRVVVSGDYADEGEPDMMIEVLSVHEELEANCRLVAASDPESVVEVCEAFLGQKKELARLQRIEQAADHLSDIYYEFVGEEGGEVPIHGAMEQLDIALYGSGGRAAKYEEPEARHDG